MTFRKPAYRLASEDADTIHFFGSDVRLAGTGPTQAREVIYLNGLNADGTLATKSYWADSGRTAFKWGDSSAGTGATISYSFAARSNFTAIEKSTFEKAFAMWASVANVTFVNVTDMPGAERDADVLLKRGRDGGAYNLQSTTIGVGTELGTVAGQSLISIDTRTPGFDLGGSFNRVGGYGLSTVIHEVGHLLGLGHAGDYNGGVDPTQQQYSAYDNGMYTVMSYISWVDEDAKYAASNPVQGTNWGNSADGYYRQAPHSIMMLDIAAIQQLYGAATTTPFAGGQVYGFNSNIAGALAPFFDFTQNKTPIVTLYNQGRGNTLDLSGYRMDQFIDVAPGAFSSIGGLTNNVAVAQDTVIETVVGGWGTDTIYASDTDSTLSGRRGDDHLHGGAGRDILTGGVGADIFYLDDLRDSGRTAATADMIRDFRSSDGDRIDLIAIDAIRGGEDDAFRFIGTSAFSGSAGELRYEVKGNYASVTGDVNGDGKADFMLRLYQVDTLTAEDFRL